MDPVKPIEEAKAELLERSEAIRTGAEPQPERLEGESDEAYLERIAEIRRQEMQQTTEAP